MGCYASKGQKKSLNESEMDSPMKNVNWDSFIEKERKHTPKMSGKKSKVDPKT